jgi:hypothetical protein
MIGASITAFCWSRSIIAATPEPLDVDFLDYLASCEGKDDNWTVVADEKTRRRLPEKKKAPESKPEPKLPEKESKPEVKP